MTVRVTRSGRNTAAAVAVRVRRVAIRRWMRVARQWKRLRLQRIGLCRKLHACGFLRLLGRGGHLRFLDKSRNLHMMKWMAVHWRDIGKLGHVVSSATTDTIQGRSAGESDNGRTASRGFAAVVTLVRTAAAAACGRRSSRRGGRCDVAAREV